MKEFVTKSGANVTINAASWKDAKALKKSIEREIDLTNGININADSSTIFAAVLKVDSSDSVDAALWPCLIRCLRNGEKITENTFNDVDARKDYYEIVIECVKENLSPLVESLFFLLSESGLIKKTQPITQK